MKDDLLDDLEFAGEFTVDSGQAMVGDPCYLDDWDNNTNDEWNLEGKLGDYSYQGASATTLANSFGTVGMNKAVVFNTGYGDGVYPVYVKLNDEGRVSMVVIDFENNLEMLEEN
jgi:hypothetical protein